MYLYIGVNFSFESWTLSSTMDGRLMSEFIHYKCHVVIYAFLTTSVMWFKMIEWWNISYFTTHDWIESVLKGSVHPKFYSSFTDTLVFLNWISFSCWTQNKILRRMLKRKTAICNFFPQHSLVYLLLCSLEERNSNKKRWGNDNRIFIFGWNMPYKPGVNGSKPKFKKDLLAKCLKGLVHPKLKLSLFVLTHVIPNLLDICSSSKQKWKYSHGLTLFGECLQQSFGHRSGNMLAWCQNQWGLFELVQKPIRFVFMRQASMVELLFIYADKYVNVCKSLLII